MSSRYQKLRLKKKKKKLMRAEPDGAAFKSRLAGEETRPFCGCSGKQKWRGVEVAGGGKGETNQINLMMTEEWRRPVVALHASRAIVSRFFLPFIVFHFLGSHLSVFFSLRPRFLSRPPVAFPLCSSGSSPSDGTFWRWP